MKLIAIDMDGTLLNSKNKIDIENIEAIKEISNTDGFLPYICTGRDIDNVKNFLKKHNLDIITVGLNGAIGYNGDELLFEYGFESETLKKITDVLDGFPYKIYSTINRYNTKNYLENFRKIHKPYIDESNEYEYLREEEYENTIPSIEIENVKEIKEKICKIYIFIPDLKRKSELVNKLSKISGVTATESAHVNIEIIPSNVNKGYVFDYLADIYNLKNIVKIAIGDSPNDYHMFKKADYGFAVKNAHTDIKKLATHHVSSNDNLGVKEALDIIKKM